MAIEIQAHRGGRDSFPENTLQAFIHAASLGVKVLELDLVVSSDHEIVVSHDSWICLDAEGYRHTIYEMPYADIALVDCGIPDRSFPGQARVTAFKPLLKQVFREVDAFVAQAGMKSDMVYNLEIKSWPDRDEVFHPTPDRYAELVVELVEAAGVSSRVRIQSFDYRVVREAWKLNPNLCYGLLIEKSSNIERFLSELGFVPAYLNPQFTLIDREMVASLHKQGMKVIPWTVNSPDEMLRMKRIGADGFITDYPEFAIGLFSEEVPPLSVPPVMR